MKKVFTIRRVLSVLLLISLIYCGYCVYYKIRYWGFAFDPGRTVPVWNIDAHISFMPTGEKIKVSLAEPNVAGDYKILTQDISAKGYNVVENAAKKRFEMTSPAQVKRQNIYYHLTVYDNEDTRGKFRDDPPEAVKKPLYDERMTQLAAEILSAAESIEGNLPQKIIGIFNTQPLDPSVYAFLPVKVTEKQRADMIIDLLALKNVPARLIRGVWLEEGKKAAEADLMLEAHDGSKWRVYDLHTGAAGLPKNFIVFQRGGVSLLDVSGGVNSKIRFSVLRSSVSSFKMAAHRAKLNEDDKLFGFSVYSLPLLEQNTLKWLMVFPLGILVVVLMRNVVGIPTMGTFTPMLLAMSLVKTGFWPGMICFGVIVAVGVLLRTLLSKLNLLLVPRISAVVIFVILIIQYMTIAGYRLNWDIASSAVFFPIIITAWIIERMSITWEEEGPANACKEIFYSMMTAIATYVVISNEQVRHVTFAFNEINLVILVVVMLLGTYTGYRLTELKRFSPLAKGM